jgi:MinD superfamily P-loop ATPase
MPEILVISGKGGTGKTSLTAAFAHLAGNAVLCDLDVDAPDLHLILDPQTRTTHDFYSGFEAVVEPDRCSGCGACLTVCRFDAVRQAIPAPVVDPLRCEGCKVCVEFCPENAIAFRTRHCGTWSSSETRFGPMLHAQLFPGEENSGRLVALLRQKAKTMAQARKEAFILSDGPPGIGCPVISALSGVDLAVIITEPTPSGHHDLERVASLCDHFKIPVAAMINKSDLSARLTKEIEALCAERGYGVVAKLPYDPVFVQAMMQAKAVTEISNGRAARRIRQAWDHIVALAIADPGLADSRRRPPVDAQGAAVLKPAQA